MLNLAVLFHTQLFHEVFRRYLALPRMQLDHLSFYVARCVSLQLTKMKQIIRSSEWQTYILHLVECLASGSLWRRVVVYEPNQIHITYFLIAEYSQWLLPICLRLLYFFGQLS